MFKFRRIVVTSLLLIALFGMSVMNAGAAEVTLTNNTGTSSSVWFITGEASLVMNGFDLQARGISRPTRINRVSIDVAVATPGIPVEVVIYEDANGGSPIDATLVRRTQVDITTTGVFNVDFSDPVVINQPVVWVGFYLPVNFQFRADRSGTSVLTYWAWQPNDRFDLSNLSTAGVFGPGNGTAPVSIDMGGIARITAQVITDDTVIPTTTTPPATTAVSGSIRQVVGPSTADLTPLVSYPSCGVVYYDTQDIIVTYRSGVRWFCQTMSEAYAPRTPDGYTRHGLYFDVYVFGVTSGVNRLPYPVTHCMRPLAQHVERAVIGLAHGAPRQWEILPSVRFGEFVCAELHYAGSLSYFTPN